MLLTSPDQDCQLSQVSVILGASEASSKRRRTDISDQAHKTTAAPSNHPDSTMHTSPGADADALPDTAWNAARLQPGMTEVLVAPGLPLLQRQAEPASAGNGSTEQETEAPENLEPTGDAAESTHSQGLELHLEAESEANAAVDAADQPTPAELQEHTDSPKASMPDASHALSRPQEAAAADEEADDAQSVKSMMSDGGDSYQGLPAETLAHLAASANADTGDTTEQAQQESATLEQGAALGDAAEHSRDADEQLQQDRNPRATPSMQSGSPCKADLDSSMHEAQLEQAQEASQKPTVVQEVDEEQPAAESTGMDVAEGVTDSAAQALIGSEINAWQKGTRVEVAVTLDFNAWSWQRGFLCDPYLPGVSSEATVKWDADVFMVSQPIETARLRPVPPCETYTTEADKLCRGRVLEIKNGNGSFSCAVLVGRVNPVLEGQRDLHSIVHGLHVNAQGMFMQPA